MAPSVAFWAKKETLGEALKKDPSSEGHHFQESFPSFIMS